MDHTDEYIKTLEWFSTQYELPEKINEESVITRGSIGSIFALCGKDLTEVDFSDLSEETFIKLAFNEYTKFPFDLKIDYKKILHNSLNPGLGVYDLNRQQINGTGINAAVIDKPMLTAHNEFINKIKQYKLILPENEFNSKMHFHGITCAGFLCGNNCGTANNANLYYYAYPDYFKNEEMYWNYHFNALDMIYEHNRTTENQIKVVSISAGFSENMSDLQRKMNDYIQKLEETGCYVVFSNNFCEIFTGSSRVYGINTDKPDAYKLDLWQTGEWFKDKILVPAGGRTSPCNSGTGRYMYNGNQSSNSWAIPYLCGILCLALQVDKKLSFNKFCEIAKVTAHRYNSLFILNPKGIIDKIRNGDLAQ